MEKRKSLDRKDRQLLAILQREGRLPNAELARRVHLSPSPCLERVRRLEQLGYIHDYVARLDAGLLDMAQIVFIQVRLDQKNLAVFNEFRSHIRNMPEVQECHMMAGEFDYLLKVRVPDVGAYRELLGTRLDTLPGVVHTVSHVVIDEVKSSTALPLPETDEQRD